MEDELTARGKSIADSGRHWPKSPIAERNGHGRTDTFITSDELDDLRTDEAPLPPEPPIDVDDHHVGEWPGDSVHSVDSVADDAQTDGEPVPLLDAVELPPFPVDALPEHIANMVDAVAEATQTDPAMAATSALTALSACTGGHAEIEIRPGWRETLNVYAATVAAPGERKSPVQYAMVRPIHDVEAQLVATGAPARLEAETRKQVAVKAAERQRNAAAGAAPDDRDEAMAEAIGATMLAESIGVPPIPRLVADDITPEALGSLLAEQGGRLAIISAEGGVFDIIAGRYSQLPNMDLWLKAWCGDVARVDRKGRAPEYVRRPVLTLGLMVQPSVLHTIAANREFRGRGLLARFLYALPVSKVGHRKIAPPHVDSGTEEGYSVGVRGLAAGLAGWRGEPAILTLTHAAQEGLEAIEAAVEPTLADDGELAQLKEWGAKYVGEVARIAGILHLAEHGADKGVTTPVEARTIQAGFRIGEYFKVCAISTFAGMGTDQATADATYLLARIEKLYGNGHEVSERDLHVASRGRFKTKSDLKPALNRLVEHGYLVSLPVPKPDGVGRPASPRFKVRTEKVRTKNTQSTETCS